MPSVQDKESPIGSLGAAFQLALHQREFEISQLTQRNNFFMIFQGVLIAGLVQSGGTAAAVVSFALCSIGFVISLFQVGMAAGSKYWQVRWERAAKTTEIWLLHALQDEERISHFFTADGKDLSTPEKNELDLINTRSKRQQDPLTMDRHSGRDKNRVELALGGAGLIKWLGNRIIMRAYSVSRIPIYVGIALAMFWLFLLTFTISIDGVRPIEWISAIPWQVHLSLVPFSKP